MNGKANRQGWVPALLTWQGGEAFVDWCWLGTQRFLQPFFDDTIEIARQSPFNTLFMHRTPMAELGAWHAASPGLPPAGFIFHMSRCGSTLISQMLGALPETVVLSEASPIDLLARTTRVSEPIRAEWLRWMIGALSQRRSGTETSSFIKFDSPTVMALAFIRRTFPTVPWIFVFRKPEEVLLSQMRETAAAMTPGIITDLNVLDTPLREIVAMPPEQYAARVIGRLCEHAAHSLDQAGLLVNYEQLPDFVWTGIATHFNLDLTTSDLANMQQASLRDAKRPRRTFRKSIDKISEPIRDAATKWILPHYNELERLRLSRE